MVYLWHPTAANMQKVEFYFGDTNLATDTFLFNELNGGKNNPVDLDIIMKFGRMKRCKSKAVVVTALKESKTLNITGEEGKEKVNRKVPFDENSAKAGVSHMERSIYAKGFGKYFLTKEP